MKEQLLALARRAWNDFRGFSLGQKVVTVFAVMALLVGGIIYATWNTSETYAPLYTNLAASDASAIVDKLNSQGIPYKLAAAGTEIMVPQSKVYSTRLTISSAGLPSSNQTGYSLLDKEGVTTSEFKQQVDYQRAIEGELGRTIQSMSGVQGASVHLAIPQQNVFNDGSQKTTAAVLLSLGSGTQLTTQQVQSIVYLVSSSVPNLSADDVTVTDASGQLLAAPGQGIAGSAGTDTRTQAVEDYNAREAARLQALIAPVVGAGHAVVTVNADLNFDKTSTTRKSYIYDPKNPPVSESTTKETYNGNQTNAGTLGAGTATTGSTGGNGAYNKTSDTRDNALGTETQTVVNAPGSVNKEAIGVLIDSSVKGVSLARVDSLLRSAAGFNATRGDTLSIQAMAFDQTAAKQAAKDSAAAAKAAAAAKSHAQLVSYAKQGLLALALLAVLIGTWLASRKRRKSPPEPYEREEHLGPPPVIDPAPAVEIKPTIGAEEVREAAARRRALLTLAEEQPKDVASVLSGWLNSSTSDINERNGRGAWSSTLSGPGPRNGGSR